MSLFLKNNPSANERFFQTIDSDNKAYWIGFLLTDGTTSKKSGIEISLQQRDGYILEKLQSDIGLTNHIRTVYSKGIPYTRITIWSVQMEKDLEKYGIVPNKTNSLVFPTNIPNKYIPALIRGMFDGDGGITVGTTTRFYKHRNKSYTNQYRELSFTGTYSMCDGFQQTISTALGIPTRGIFKNNRTVFRVRWNSIEDITKIARYMYNNSGDYKLERKYSKIMDLIGGI